jgi:hypothetical protein
MPVTILAAIRTGSLAPPSSSEKIVNRVAPAQIKIIVLKPAALA